MRIQRIESRKNEYIKHLRRLQKSSSYRKECGEFLCDGAKLLEDALQAGAVITSVLWREESNGTPAGCREYAASSELFQYVSPLENSPGPLFTVAIPGNEVRPVSSAIVLENVQDPGNVGTVIRTAAAFGIEAVVLCGDCADVYNPKTVRSTMGAIFRQYIYFCEKPDDFARRNNLTLYGAALGDRSADLRTADLHRAAVCIGNEGHGLSEEMLSLCRERLIIPMRPEAESLNAAVAASIVMWEMVR
ncbi:MAG: RNA methyltransferase [Firmicutes bacterium]|nr:RNA methyltransferase [Bacillota bacterium]